MQVAIKFEHTSSKGLTSKGVPYEWEVYTQLGETHGVPRLLHKGFQDGFCIMVSLHSCVTPNQNPVCKPYTTDGARAWPSGVHGPSCVLAGVPGLRKALWWLSMGWGQMRIPARAGFLSQPPTPACCHRQMAPVSWSGSVQVSLAMCCVSWYICQDIFCDPFPGAGTSVADHCSALVPSMLIKS